MLVIMMSVLMFLIHDDTAADKAVADDVADNKNYININK